MSWNWKFTATISVAVLAAAVLAGSAVWANAGCCGMSAATPPASQPTTQALVVNDHCPIMGSAIDPANVPESLTRTYKGQKVGFCCGGCPGAWDKLTDAQKEAKLDAVRAK